MDYELGIVLRKYWVGSWDCKVCGFTNHRDDPDTCVLCYSPRRPTTADVGKAGRKKVSSKSKVMVSPARGYLATEKKGKQT